MNAEPSSKTIEILRTAFVDTQKDTILTFPAINPTKKIDFIFADRNHPFRVLAAEALPFPYSDHLPIVTTVSIWWLVIGAIFLHLPYGKEACLPWSVPPFGLRSPIFPPNFPAQYQDVVSGWDIFWARIFAVAEIPSIFAFESGKRSWFSNYGSLAQLVQSICLTSRGSLVRIQ